MRLAQSRTADGLAVPVTAYGGRWFDLSPVLGLRLRVNGGAPPGREHKNMIFGVDHLIWYLSQFMTLYPGDVINTGTPAGVAMGRPGTPYLRPADVVEIEIDGLGRQRQIMKAA